MRFTKSVLLSAGLFATVGSASFAGGYIAPVVDPAPVAVTPVVAAPSGWAGFYGGVGLGYAFGGDDEVGVQAPTGGTTNIGSLDMSGVNGSVQMGYRFQTALRGRQIIIGPELSYENGSVDDSIDGASTELTGLLALRVKTGVVSSTGNMLYYGILGAARGEFDYTVQAAGMNYDGDYKDNAYLLGFGAERKVSDRLSVFGEYEYRGFGKTTLTDAAGFETEATPDHHNVKVGVNFNF